MYHTLTSSVLTDAAFSLIILVCQKPLSPHLLKCIAVSKVSPRNCLIAIYLAILTDTQARQHMPTIPGLKRWRQEDQGLKINLNYTGNVRPAWATVRLYQLEKRRHGDVLVCFLLCLNFSCDKNQWPKSTRERKAYFSLQLEVAIHHWEKSGQEFKTVYRGQELKQKPWRSAAGWVAPPGFVSLIFLYSPGLFDPELALPTIDRAFSWTCLRPVSLHSSSVESPSSQVILGYVKLTIEINWHGAGVGRWRS